MLRSEQPDLWYGGGLLERHVSGLALDGGLISAGKFGKAAPLVPKVAEYFIARLKPPDVSADCLHCAGDVGRCGILTDP